MSINNTNYISPLCDKCDDNIPSLQIIKGKLKIKCNCEEHYNLLSLQSYINKININKEKKCVYNNRCKEHKEVLKFYCKQCFSSLCQIEKDTHHQHDNIVSFDDLSINSILNDIKKGEVHLNNYLLFLKNKYNTKEVNFAYEKCIKRNRNILTFIQVLLDNYKFDNYTMYSNIKRNTFLNIYRHIDTKDNNISSIIDYFTNYNLCSFDPVESVNPHTDYINSVVLLKDGRIASCSDDSTIKIFNPLKNYKCEITLKGHNEGVNSICIIDSGQLVSCSRDGIYKIWTINEKAYKCEYTNKNPHDNKNQIDAIVSFDDNCFITSSSEEEKMKIWNGNSPYSNIPIKEISIRDEFNSSLFYMREKKLLITSSYILSHIWNMETYQCISTFSCVVFSTGLNCIYQLDDSRIIIGGKKGMIIINVDKSIIETSIKKDTIDFQAFTLLRDNKTILCGCSGGIFAFYDTKEKTMNLIKSSVNESIDDVKVVSDNTIVSMSSEGIFIWKY